MYGTHHTPRLTLALTLFAALLTLAPGPASAAGTAAQSGEELLEAARRGDAERVRALLAAGVPVESANRYGTTALFFAADRGHEEIVRLLLEAGARTDVTDTFYGFSPLAAALQKGNVAIGILLLEAGAPDHVNAVFFAIRERQPALLRAALARGPLPAAARDQALAFAAEEELAEMVALLEEAEVATEEERSGPVVIDPVILESFAGTYRDETSGRVVEVRVHGGTIVAKIDDRELPLEPVEERSFESPDQPGLALSFNGRGGTVEFVQLREGDSFTGLRPVDPEELAIDPVIVDVGGGDLAPAVSSPHWPAFRGTDAAGSGDGHEVPRAWDIESGENVAWKTPIPGIANASPVVWGDAIYVTTAISSAGDDTVRIGLYGDVQPVDDVSEHSFRLYRLDRRSGAIVWEREVHRGAPAVKRHPKASQANSTPVTDGERVVVLFGSVGVLAAYDAEGAELWKRDLGALDSGWFWDPDVQWGHAASPVLYGDSVIVQADVQRDESWIGAFALSDGEELWRTARDEIPTWGSPAVYRGRPRDELITNGTTIRAYDPTTGAELWSLGPNSEVVVATPVIAGETVYVTAGYPPIRPIYAVRPGGEGDLSLPEGVDATEHIQWSKERGGTYIPTPIAYRGLLYTLANNGILTAYRLENGEMVHRTRVAEGGSYVASPVAADGRLYFASEDGVVHVVEAGPDGELLSSNEMGEVIWATPAITPGLLVVRTLGHVWGIGEAR